MIFTKHRFEIWSQTQHPYKHTLSDFSFANPALPGVSNLEDTINWIIAVIYPNTKPSVADVASLPLAGNTINDYRVVLDDGDGKAASYRWEQREGEVAASWHKIYDMDWGQDSILAAFLDNTQDLYVWRDGRTQLDGSGNPIVGLYAGQTIFGGNSANQNLTLKANSGDGVGPSTGFVQVDDILRPAVTNAYDLGTSALRWKDIYAQNSAVIDTLSIASGSITDTSGVISFGNEDLVTTGEIAGFVVVGGTLVADDTVNTATITPGNYIDTTGAVYFGASNLTTLGEITANQLTLIQGGQTVILDPDGGVGTRFTTTAGLFDFDNENLLTTGSLIVGDITGTRLDVDDIRLDGNTISITTLNTNLIIQANGTGIVDIQNPMTTLGQTITGTVTVTGQFNIDNIRVDGNTISSTNTNGNVNIHPNGTGHVNINANIHPNSDGTRDLGETANRWNNLYLAGGFYDGTNNIAMSTLLAFRSGIWRDLAQTIPAQAGDTLFYDDTNDVWLANHPDTEIDHSEITGLTTTDAGHTQFVMLAGRAGGQTIQGGTAASENLVLESTSHATKGDLLAKDDLIPFTNASFSGSWSGTDLGDSTHYFRDLYTKGELKGARLENFTTGTLPAASGQNIGRTIYSTDDKKMYVDTGSVVKVIGASRFVSDVVFDGVVLFVDTTVSSEISDARNATWQVHDNANNFEVMYLKVTATSATNVRITTNVALPAGSYRLIGVE
jgi:hypothetical protein